MKETLEKIWDEYFSDECAAMDTDEEKALAKKTIELYEKANALLNKNQQDAVEKFLDASCDMEAHFMKKAFFKGCEFAVSFLLESKNLEK